MNTKALANRLVQRCKTRDPFQIVEELGFITITTHLVDVRGYHQYVQRCHIIYLDDRLIEWDRRWVCAHELGHALMHGGIDRVFMDSCTCMVASRYEIEANHFAVDLLYDDFDLQDFLECSIETASQAMGLCDQSLTAYRLRSVQPTLWRK